MLYNIFIHPTFNLINITAAGQIILSFKDIKGKNTSSFTREINKTSKYVFVNSNLILKELIRKTTFMTSIKTDKKPSNRILTLDIETMNVKNKLVPYCIS